jgi:hypothetical protein
MRTRAGVFVLLGAIAAAAPATPARQIQYSTGQNVVPVYEGWRRNPDGTITMMFGYMNRNYEEEVNVPIGPDNMFEDGPADRGQPTHFYTRRQMFVFEVQLPRDWGTKDLVWRLTSHGRTDKAYGSMMEAYELSDVVIRENRIQDMGRGGGEPNEPPKIQAVGPVRLSIARPSDAVQLIVAVSDDGFPTPRSVRSRPPSTTPRIPKPSTVTQAVIKPRPETGLTVGWVHYRGEGTVTFHPLDPPVEGGRATTTATFSRPGTYVLRAYADDSVLTASIDVTVDVGNAR